MAGRGYGTSDYGQSLYGVTLYLDGVATVSASASVASLTGEFVIEGSANTVQGTSSVASAAVEVFDGLASGGGSAAGSTVSAERIQLGSATSAGSASTTASLQFITNASGSTAATATLTSAGLRVPEGSATIPGAVTFTSQAFITAKGVSTVTGSASVADLDGIGYRVREAEASTVQGVSTFASVDGREKWEAITIGAQSWDTISTTSITWSNVA